MKVQKGEEVVSSFFLDHCRPHETLAYDDPEHYGYNSLMIWNNYYGNKLRSQQVQQIVEKLI